MTICRTPLPLLGESSLRTVIKHYYGVDIKNDSDEKKVKINIEEIYSFLEISMNIYSGNLFQRNLLVSAKDELIFYIDDVIRFCGWESDASSFYRLLAKHIDSKVSIITFNWDLLIDKALEKEGDAVSLLKKQGCLLDPYRVNVESSLNIDDVLLKRIHEGYLLKPHGALNLAICTDISCPHSHMPYKFSLNAESIETWTCLSCGSPLKVMIMPPQIHKTYKHNRFMQLQASIASSKLSLAREIIIIGYSFPVFDYEAGMLLRLARMEPWETIENIGNLERVVSVDRNSGNKDYQDRIKSLFGVDYSRDVFGKKIEFDTYESITEYTNNEF